MYSRETKSRYTSENNDKKRNKQKLFNTGHQKHLYFSIARAKPEYEVFTKNLFTPAAPPPPKFCKTIDCFQFLLCITVVPREMEENDYAKRFSFLFFFFFFFFFFFWGGGGGEREGQGVLWSMWKWWITTATLTHHHKHLSFSISRKNPWVRGCWCETNENRKITLREIPYGLAVRIPGFHPGGPGSTPGMGKKRFFSFCFNNSGFSVVYSYVRFLGLTSKGDNNFKN